MKTIIERQYELEKNLFYTATIKRTGESFNFGFVENRTADTTATEQIHGFNGGETRRTIETVDKVKLRVQDVIDLGEWGFAKVISTAPVFLREEELRFIKPSQASRVLRISVVGAGQ